MFKVFFKLQKIFNHDQHRGNQYYRQGLVFSQIFRPNEKQQAKKKLDNFAYNFVSWDITSFVKKTFCDLQKSTSMRYVFEKTIICGCIFHLLVRNLMYLLNRRSTHQTKERTQLLFVVLKNPTFSKIVVLRNRRLL